MQHMIYKQFNITTLKEKEKEMHKQTFLCDATCILDIKSITTKRKTSIYAGERASLSFYNLAESRHTHKPSGQDEGPINHMKKKHQQQKAGST